MSEPRAPAPLSLYEEDETAWLEQTASLVAQRRFDEIDQENLKEYLCDMARRDKREVLSRLVTLIAHLLKWEHQPEHRSHSWRGTILAQRQELGHLLESGTLSRHAAAVLGKAYKEAVARAAEETGLVETVFPSDCSMSLEDVLAQAHGA
jgi:hypothetical protein